MALVYVGAKYVTMAACLMTAMAVDAKVFIATPADINSVLANAGSGDTISMIGVFGDIVVHDRSFSKRLVMDGSKATFTGRMILDNVNGVVISGGTYDVSRNGLFAKAAEVWGGANVYFRYSNVLGGADQFGITFAGTRNAAVTNSTFTGLTAGIGYNSVFGGYISRNTFTHSFTDGVEIANSHYVDATYNTCSAGNPSPGAHPDCIQLWSVTGHALESDINLNHNSAYGPTQGFSDFDAGLRISITDNLVNTSMPLGVACFDCIDSNISRNRLSTLPGSQFQTRVAVLRGHGNIVEGNSVAPYNEPRLSSSVSETLTGSLSGVYTRNMIYSASVSIDQSEAFSSAVTEPATWLMLITGFTTVGLLARLRTYGKRGLSSD